MKKAVILISVAWLMAACNSVHTDSEKHVTQGEDTIATADISTSKLDAVEELAKDPAPEKTSGKLLMKASGAEPGWFAEFYDHKLRAVLNYGKDSILLEQAFDGLTNPEGYSLYTKEVSVKIVNKPCTNAAGDQLPRTVTISYHGKSYTGCGELIK